MLNFPGPSVIQKNVFFHFFFAPATPLLLVGNGTDIKYRRNVWNRSISPIFVLKSVFSRDFPYKQTFLLYNISIDYCPLFIFQNLKKEIKLMKNNLIYTTTFIQIHMISFIREILKICWNNYIKKTFEAIVYKNAKQYLVLK